MATIDDVDRVRAIAELARELGMHVNAIVVGDIRLVLAAPWGPRVQSAPEDSLHPTGDESPPDKLEEARIWARKEFGRSLPDDTVKALAGIPQ